MKRLMVRYKVKSERAEENASYVLAVFDQLKASASAGIRYITFRLDDGVSFVHIASIETADGSNPLDTLPAFQTFTSGIRDRCEEAPVAQALYEVAEYRFFGA